MALGTVIALHHSTLSMGDMHHGMDAGSVAELCLGVFAAVGAAVIATTLAIVALGRWRPVHEDPARAARRRHATGRRLRRQRHHWPRRELLRRVGYAGDISAFDIVTSRRAER